MERGVDGCELYGVELKHVDGYETWPPDGFEGRSSGWIRRCRCEVHVFEVGGTRWIRRTSKLDGFEIDGVESMDANMISGHRFELWGILMDSNRTRAISLKLNSSYLEHTNSD